MVAVTAVILINNNNNKVSQSCPTLWDPTDCSLPGSSIHGIFSGKNTGSVCYSLLVDHVLSELLSITCPSWLAYMPSSPITSWKIKGEKVQVVTDFILGGSKISADSNCSNEIQTLTPWKESYDKPRQYIKKKTQFANKGPSSQSHGFSSSHVWMRELGHKEEWVPKNCCSWTVVL